MTVLKEYWMLILVTLDTASTLPPCRLGEDLLNGLVNSRNKDGIDYGIENTFGLVGDDPGHGIEQEHLSPKEIQECIQHYFHSGPLDNQKPEVSTLNLHYERLPNMGNQLAIPVPIPEDEDYLPGKEGYTTYINPYNFKEKSLYINNNKKTQKKKKSKGEDLDEKFIDELLSLFEDWL